MLGLFADTPYQSETVSIQPGDHLVLFTDGVLEARNAVGEEFGEERLFQLLKRNAQKTAPEILALIRESVISFSAKAPQHDDITIMVLGFRESAAAADLRV